MVSFDRFKLDPANLRLEGPSGAIRLNPKSFDVLRVLVERRGQLVRKNQLLDEVWRDTHVGDGVLKVCMTEIRRALGDSASRPRFIETVHRRGYRFIAEVTDETASVPQPPALPPALAVDDAEPPASPTLVGRAREVQLLEDKLARALAGQRQVVFVTGEPGAGKTALVEHFVERAAARQTLAVTRGQTLEHFGSAEPYMPVLEAIGRLGAETRGARPLLRRYAPTWLAQLPWLVDDADREALARELLGATRERMLREIAAFLDALAARVPVVFVLEDLHWSDPSTVDLLSLLAARRERARLLVLATYRPVELILGHHPLRAISRSLLASGRASELALDPLDADGVAEYLDARFPGGCFPSAVAKLLCERTDGNPLFLVALVDHLLASGALLDRGGLWEIARDLRDELTETPDTLRRLIEQQLERLDDEDHRLLEAASLTGTEFAVAAAAAGADRAAADVEERCGRLAVAGQFLGYAGTGEWPDGTLTARYCFRHELYRDTLLKSTPSGRRAECQLRIGKALERAFGERAPELAATLSVHFAEGGDRVRAVRYRRMAAETAVRRHALVEAESHLESGLALLETLPASLERDAEELQLQNALGAVRIATHGYAAPEVVSAYTRALELASATPEAPSVYPVLWGLWMFHATRGEFGRAMRLAERNFAIGEASADPLLRLVAHLGLWTTHFFRGELAAALRHLDEGTPLYDLVDHGAALAYGQDQKVVAFAMRSIVLWHVGAVDSALEARGRALEHARALGHPMSVAFAMTFGAWLRILRREPEACRDEAQAAIVYATDQGLPHWLPGAMHSRGWACVELGDLAGGIGDMERALALLGATGASMGRGPRSLDLAGALARAGRLSQARELVEGAKALLTTTGERYHEAELHRLDAEVLLAEAGGAEASAEARMRAEHAVGRAVECARCQGARSLELRALAALVRIRKSGARARQARAQLAACLATFTEGADTADVREARSLLDG